MRPYEVLVFFRKEIKWKGKKMTSTEIKDYSKQLSRLSKKSASGEAITDWRKRYKDLKEIYSETETLAIKLGVLLVGANYMNLAISTNSIEKRVIQIASYLAELFNNIRNALQMEMMLNACISAEGSSDLAKQACKSAKWSCIWAAVAAIAACISVILVCFLG